MNYITDRIRDNKFSHIAPLCGLVRGLAVVAVSLPILLFSTGCATDLGNQRHAQHGADQVRMIAIQREARAQEKEAQAEANEKLFEALARVAESNPDHAPSVAVALAVIGVRGADSVGGDAPTVTLQQQRNEALEWTKALVPTVGGLVTGLGVAAINAEVQKNASDNNRDILLGDQAADRGIVEAVANLGTSAVNNAGLSVGGSYYDMQDSASVDNSTTSSMDTITTTTNETSLDTSTTYDASEDGFIVNGNYDYQFLDDGATVTYGGEQTNLGSIVEYLQGLGQPYSLTLDGEVYASSSEGEGEAVTIDCTQAMFSPKPPECN
jgi:hypothetical protein